MSLILRRLPGWTGKLFSALVGVNVRCASEQVMSRDLPVDAREYLLTPTRAPSAGETIDGEPRLVWRATVGRGVRAPAVSSRCHALTSTDRWVYAIDNRSGAMFWRRRGDGAYTTAAVVRAAGLRRTRKALVDASRRCDSPMAVALANDRGDVSARCVA